MRQYAASLVGQVVASDAKYTHDNMTRKRCPVCDKFLLEVNGKKGKMLVCQDRECGLPGERFYAEQRALPNCHKKLEIRRKRRPNASMSANAASVKNTTASISSSRIKSRT